MLKGLNVSVNLSQKWAKLGSEIYIPIIETIIERKNAANETCPKILKRTLKVLFMIHHVLNNLRTGVPNWYLCQSSLVKSKFDRS